MRDLSEAETARLEHLRLTERIAWQVVDRDDFPSAGIAVQPAAVDRAMDSSLEVTPNGATGPKPNESSGKDVGPAASKSTRGRSVRSRRPNDKIAEIRSLVRQMWEEKYTHRQMCKRLGNHDRPPHVAWKEFSWPVAYRKHTNAVKKWLSQAVHNAR